MKKTFKTLAFMLLSVWAFSSCEDVPEPYNLPQKIENGSSDGGSAITGTPVTCAEALAIINALADGASTSEIYSVTGYITDAFQISGKPCFYISDTPGGGKDIEAFAATLPTGVTEFVVGQKVTITGKLQKYVDKNGKVIPEVNTPTVTILDGDTTGDQGDAIKVGCAEAVRATSALDDGATSTETYSITGYITEIIGNPSASKTGQMQQSFWMADTKDGGKVFEAYWANLPAGVDAFVAGSKVTITGKLYKYMKNGEMTAEIKNANVVILEQGDGGNTGDGGDTGDTGDTGDATSITCAEAVTATNALNDGATSTDTYSITGYITEIIGNPSASQSTGQMQQSFWMADTKDGGKVFEAYWANLPEGVDAFVVGSKVTITGKLYKYVKNGAVTAEIKNANVVILEQGEGGNTGGGDNTGGDQGDGGNTGTLSSLTNGGFESWVSNTEAEGWKSACSASSADVSSNTDAHSGSYSCAVAGIASSNKRLATKEITLEAGSYTFSFYAKATTADLCQTRAGYVPLKTDGTVGSYLYGNYVDINNNGWTLVSYDFTLTEQTTVCLVMMNPKTNAGHTVSQTILVDDATLVKK